MFKGVKVDPAGKVPKKLLCRTSLLIFSESAYKVVLKSETFAHNGLDRYVDIVYLASTVSGSLS